MKKTLISLLVVTILVAGYFVGNATLKTKSPTSRIEPAVLDGRSSNSSAGQKSQSYAGKTADVIETEPCIDCVSPIPPVGNPKGNKIVKTGTVNIRIPRNSVSKKYDEIVSLIPEGGYVEGSSSTLRTSTVTVRIPSEKLDSSLRKLRKVGTVTKESIESFDRTFDAIDYDARLKIMRERETVLLELLKKASTASETATIQEQIFNLRQDIEVTQGQKDLLDNQVALSTLTISLKEKGVKDSHNSKSILEKSWTKATGSLLTTVGGMLIVVSAIFPFIIVGFVIYFVAKGLRKKSKS